MLDAWRNPFAHDRGSAIALDEDYRREVLEDARLDAEERRRIEQAMTLDDKAARDAELKARDRATDLATYGRFACPECLAPAGEFCVGRETDSHYARAVVFSRRA